MTTNNLCFVSVVDNGNLHLISKITVLLVVRVVVVVTCPFIATTTHDALTVSRYSFQQIIIILRLNNIHKNIKISK